MEDPRQLMRYLTIEDILIIAETHVDNHQILHKEQLDYLVEAISAKFGDTELYPNSFPKGCGICPSYYYRTHIFRREQTCRSNVRAPFFRIERLFPSLQH